MSDSFFALNKGELAATYTDVQITKKKMFWRLCSV
jgi:hypothetical protein